MCAEQRAKPAALCCIAELAGQRQIRLIRTAASLLVGGMSSCDIPRESACRKRTRGRHGLHANRVLAAHLHGSDLAQPQQGEAQQKGAREVNATKAPAEENQGVGERRTWMVRVGRRML